MVNTQTPMSVRELTTQILSLAAAVLLISLFCRFMLHNTYTDYIPIPEHLGDMNPEDMDFLDDCGEHMDYGEPELKDGYMKVKIQPGARGDVQTVVMSGEGTVIHSEQFYVSRLNTIFDKDSGGFTGDTIVLASLAFFNLAAAVILFRFFMGRTGVHFYSYATIYTAGFSIFAFLNGTLSLYISVRHMLRPAGFAMMDAYELVEKSGFFFIFATSPLLLAFAVWMAVSNVALLRHERYRFRNVLGLLVSALLVAGLGFAFFLYFRDYEGPESLVRVKEILQSVYSIVFVYFECMLIGSIVCGLEAARHEPPHDRDYILILGCRVRKDGTLTPLLRSRADRAIAFWKAQKEESGKEAVLIPTGGKGSDETVSEAEAIGNYLRQQGIPERAVLLEDRAENTYQNMVYSKALIDERSKDARTAFCTTNYHVFRSGVWASDAGLEAEGIGSPTKWWFWPNAFMRECIGLLQREVKQELLFLAMLTGFFTLLAMILAR